MTPATQELTRVTLDLTKTPSDDPKEVAAFVATARALEVRDDDSLAIAEQMIARAAVRVGAIEKEWDEVRDAAVKTHKAIMGKIKTWCAPWVSVRETLEPRRNAYLRDKEQKRRAEEQRVAREAEQARLKAEAEIRAEQQRVAAAARELERQGEMKKAEAARALADQAAQEKLAEARMIADAVPVVADTTVRTAGVTNARPWVGEIFDVIRIIEAIAKKEIAVVERQSDGDVELLLDGKVLVTVHKSAVSYQAKRLRREDVGIPGAKGVEEFGMRVSRTSAYADLPVVRKEEGPEW